MDLSFQEKSIIGSLLITVALFGSYFADFFSTLFSDSPVALEGVPTALVGVTITVVVIEVIYHVVIATVSRDDAEDERDKLVSARATAIAYYVMVTGCLITVGHLLLSSLLHSPVDNRMLHPLVIANFIVFWFILAEVIGFAMRLFFYRRGVQ